MTTALAAHTPIVTLKDGQAFANSRDVADFFGKQHAHVLRDIDGLMKAQPVSTASIFGASTYTDRTGRVLRCFDMTKDGFTLLAMGFTGAKALEFKLKYIAAFNEMERKLIEMATALPDFTNPAAAARAWADEVEQKQALQIENQTLKPLAKIGERTASKNHTLTAFARSTLPGVNTQKLKADLKAHNYLYRKALSNNYRVYSRFQDLFVERVNDEYGSIDIYPTAKGRTKLIELYEDGRLTMKKGLLPKPVHI